MVLVRRRIIIRPFKKNTYTVLWWKCSNWQSRTTFQIILLYDDRSKFMERCLIAKLSINILTESYRSVYITKKRFLFKTLILFNFHRYFCDIAKVIQSAWAQGFVKASSLCNKLNPGWRLRLGSCSVVTQLANK